MEKDSHRFTVKENDPNSANRSAVALADGLRQREGVQESKRVKSEGSDAAMDLGSIVSVVATSGATLALAQGVSAFLRSRKKARLTYERDELTESVKIRVEEIDPESAARIVEIVHSSVDK